MKYLLIVLLAGCTTTQPTTIIVKPVDKDLQILQLLMEIEAMQDEGILPPEALR